MIYLPYQPQTKSVGKEEKETGIVKRVPREPLERTSIAEVAGVYSGKARFLKASTCPVKK